MRLVQVVVPDERRDDIVSVLRDEELGVVAVTVEYVGIGPLFEPSTVTVTLSRTSDSAYGRLPNELARAIENRTGDSVTVSVRYRDYERSNVTTSARGQPNTVLGVES